jgi:hypothetical protein
VRLIGEGREERVGNRDQKQKQTRGNRPTPREACFFVWGGTLHYEHSEAVGNLSFLFYPAQQAPIIKSAVSYSYSIQMSSTIHSSLPYLHRGHRVGPVSEIPEARGGGTTWTMTSGFTQRSGRLVGPADRLMLIISPI